MLSIQTNNPVFIIAQEIKVKLETARQADIARLYAKLIQTDEDQTTKWANTVNTLIQKKWGKGGLNKVKRLAWAIVEAAELTVKTQEV